MNTDTERTSPARSTSGLGIKDIMTAAAMLVLSMVCNSIIAALALPIPIVYLYLAAPIEMFIGATFYLVAANRINKHGLLFIWVAIQGLIYGLLGYLFMVPYFLILAVVCELAMVGRNTYRSPIRNGIGWATLSVGMVIGNAIPLWFAWDTFQSTASAGGFSDQLIDMFVDISTNPWLLILACVLSMIGGFLGVLFGQRLLRRHFRKAGVVV